MPKPPIPTEELLKDEKWARDFFHPNDYEIMPYLVQDGKKHPCAILCPGGAYGMVCSFVEGEPFAQTLNAMGISAVVVYYHVREKALYPAPQMDLARAVREVHDRAEEWNLDMENYSVWGSSAGGHLAGSFGTESMGWKHYGLPAPGCMVLIYPVVTMGSESHGDTRLHLLGGNPSQQEIFDRSVHTQVTANYPRTFLWCGNADTTVPPVNSHMMAHALKAHGVEHQFIEYPGVDHGVGLGQGLVCEGWLKQAVAFWRKEYTAKEA